MRLLILSFRNPDYRKRINERFGYVSKPVDPRPILWVHAVSVGEVQASRPLISQLLKLHPQYQILITTITPTGAKTVEQLFGNSVSHRYVPYDLPGVVRRFLDVMKPTVLIVMETEIWPNLFFYCNCNNVPLIIANARLSKKSHDNYKYIAKLARSTLNNVSCVIAQGQTDADRFIDLGVAVDRVIVMGNLKFDIKIPESVREEAAVIRRYLSVNRPVWIAASTHDGEEKIIINSFEKVLEKHPDCLLIIAPRHPERSESVTDLCMKAGFKTIRRSANHAVSKDTSVFILDTLGELTVYYAASDVAFTGGSLVSAGGHNMLEPASLGIPVITGPYNYNFLEISGCLVECGAAWIVRDVSQLVETVNLLLADANLRYNAGEKGKKLVESNRGNADKLVEILNRYLPDNATCRHN